jgi:phenylacetate-coenzyme A ligase PaaK-like adenylate-forming protein
LALLPVTPRRLLTELPYRQFLHEGANEARLRSSYSSGSTGIPTRFYRSKAESAYRRFLLSRAARARFPRFRPMRVIDVGRVKKDAAPQVSQWFGPIRLTRVSGTISASEQARIYVDSRAQLVEGYPGSLELLARELAMRKRYPRPRWAICRGEMLTREVRSLLEKVFECPVANFYSSVEIGNMAWDCRDRPGIHHVNTDACVLELLNGTDNPVSPGEEGRVVLTNLYNRTMPLIRYDIGDHATWENPAPHRCSCGAFTPTLSSIDGRTDDYIFLPDGRRVSPVVVLTTAMFGISHVSPSGVLVGQVLQYQVVQEKIGEAVVRVVPLGTVPEGLEASVAAEFRSLHPAFLARVTVVDEIPLEPSGKLKRILCQV